MKIVLSYIKTALYNIKRNKAYAIFYILGTTLAFVFIAIILHVVKLITTDAEPMLYGDRIVTVSGSQLYMGHRTKRILRIERKEYQTY